MAKEKITLIAVGDVGVIGDDAGSAFDHVIDVLRSGDIRFANCEFQLSDRGYCCAFRPVPSDPSGIPALNHAGFDVMSVANNHTLDWGPEALLDTIARLRKAGIQPVGAGENIVEAHKPVILERKGNRVGFLAYGCNGPEHYEAEENKPGYAPMRAYAVYQEDPWHQPGCPPKVITIAYKDELAAMEEDIRKLKSQVDVVVVSYHWGIHMIPAVIPMYEFEVAHAAIDAGADIIIGGHPHILKPIEVYKGKVIFHYPNDFAFGRRGSNVEAIMAKLKARNYPPPGHDPLLLAKTYGFTPDPEIGGHPEARRLIIAKAIIEDGEIKKVSYIPCYRNKDRKPEIMTRSDPRGQDVFSYMEKITHSQNLTVNFAWEGDEVVISA